MTEELTPKQQAAQASLAHHQGKLAAAPVGSKLAANLKLRVAVEQAGLIGNATQRQAAEAAARQAHAETIAALDDAAARSAAAAR